MASQEMTLSLRQISVMLSAGVPILRCIEFVADSQTKRARTWDSIRGKLEGGWRLSRAIAHEGHDFPMIVRFLVEAGETSGQLDTTLASAVEYLERDLWLRRRTAGAFAYPLAILLVMAVVLTLMLFYVFPMELEVYRSLHLELPMITQFLVTVLQAAFHPFLWTLLFLVGSGLRVACRDPLWRNHLDRLVLRLPLVGDILSRSATARMLKAMNILLVAGENLSNLGMVGQLAENSSIQARYQTFQRLLVDGNSLSEALDSAQLFDPATRQMLSLGQESGNLADLVGKMAENCQEDLDLRLEQFTTLLEPIILAITGVVVGLVVVATSLPMLNLLDGL